jgi:molecular chaperone GrpE
MNTNSSQEPSTDPNPGQVSDEAANDTEAPVSDLMVQLEKVHQEKEELQQKLLRKAADFENFRKRALKEKEELRDSTEAFLIEDLLPAIDTLKLGLDAASKHPAADDITQGFNLVLDQFNNILNQRGLVETNPVGEPFDPKIHESISQIACEETPEGHIAETIRIGYFFKEKLLRPAMVAVSTGAPDDSEEPPTEAS